MVLLSGIAGPTAAQSVPERDAAGGGHDSTASTHPTRAPWFTHRDALWFGTAVGATAILAPFDRRISDEFSEPHWSRSRGLHHLTGDVAFLGGDGPFVVSMLLADSDAGDIPGVRRFAIHGMEAIALATVVTGIGKGLVGRALPGVLTKHEYEFGRGFHDRNGPFVSFPSGHTAAAFALATTVSAEVRRADSSRSRIASVIAFSAAGAVGVARVAQRMHWPSDLPLAAFIGVWSGETIQRHLGGAGVTNALVRGLEVGANGHRGIAIGWSSLAGSGTR